MNHSRLSFAFRSLFVSTLAALGTLAWGTPLPEKDPGILLGTMQTELNRAKTSLAKSDPAPYFLSYEVYDEHTMVIAGTYGTIVQSSAGNRRWADVTMRVGSPALDNTHNENRESGMSSGALPLADDRDAIARSLWELTNQRIPPRRARLRQSPDQHGRAGRRRRQISRFFSRNAANRNRSAIRSRQFQSEGLGR